MACGVCQGVFFVYHSYSEPRQFVDFATDATRHVQLRCDDLAGLAHLPVVGRVACVHRRAYANWPTIPQLYVNGEFLGGSDIMMEMYESGELQPLLSA